MALIDLHMVCPKLKALEHQRFETYCCQVSRRPLAQGVAAWFLSRLIARTLKGLKSLKGALNKNWPNN